MVINTIDFPNICLMGQKSDSVCNTVDVWCIKSGMETRPVIYTIRQWQQHHTSLEIFVTLFVGLTQRGQDGLFKMASAFCVPLLQRYVILSTLHIQL